MRLPGFWGDGATYYSMARSLAEDGDLRYEARDVFRARREFPSGPQGLFLKRASGGLRWDAPAASPGSGAWPRRTSRGSISRRRSRTRWRRRRSSRSWAPAASSSPTRWPSVSRSCSAYLELRTRASPSWALGAAVAVILATVAPAVPAVAHAGALHARPRRRPASSPGAGSGRCLAAVLLGIATYTKPYNLFLALPLGVEPLLRRAAATSWWPALARVAAPRPRHGRGRGRPLRAERRRSPAS